MVKRLFRTFWVGVVLVICLMSGITSIGREAVGIWYPGAFHSNQVFTFCLRLCFFISAVTVVVYQQFDIERLERKADDKSARAVVRDSLGEFIVEGQQFMQRIVKNQEEFSQWKGEVDSWYQRCYKFIESKVSAADAVLFTQLSGGRYGFSGIFNGEHADYKNSIYKYTDNLKELIARIS